LPTDDYSLLSDYLRNIETRTDLTWLVLEESTINNAVSAVARCQDSVITPRADEPFQLQKRFKALSAHWAAIARRDDKPQPWQAAFDTVVIPPLLKAQHFDRNGAVDQAMISERQQELNQQDDKTAIRMTPEQQVSSDIQFKYYLRTRSYKVSYFRLHPPKPIGFVPAAKQPFAISNAWDKIFTDGIIEAGRSVAFSQLADNDEWLPLYGSLILQHVPWSWVQEGNEEGICGGATEEMSELWMADMDARKARQEERKAKVEAWQDEVRPEREAKRKEEFKRLERERKEQALAREKQDL